MVKSRWIAILLLLILVYSSNSLGYTIDGDMVYIENNKARLEIRPHTSTTPSNTHYQEFKLIYKDDVNAEGIKAIYFFPEQPSGVIEKWMKPVYGYIREQRDFNVQVYDWNYEVTADPINPYFVTVWNPDDNTIVWQRNTVDSNFCVAAPVRCFFYDYNGLVAGNYWKNVNNKFHSLAGNPQADGNWYYYSDNFNLTVGQWLKWKLTYTTQEPSGKWNLAFVKGDADCLLDSSCDVQWVIDPWWSGGGAWSSKFAINDLVINGGNVLEDFEDISEWTETEKTGDITYQDTVRIAGNALKFDGTILRTYYGFNENEYGIYIRTEDNTLEESIGVTILNEGLQDLLRVYTYAGGTFGVLTGNHGSSHYDTGITMDANTWYWVGFKRNGNNDSDLWIYNEARTVVLYSESTPNRNNNIWGSGASKVNIFRSNAQTGVSYWDKLTDKGTVGLEAGDEIRIDHLDFSAMNIQCADLNDLRIVDENQDVELKRDVFGTSSSTDGNVTFELANPIEVGEHDGIFYIYTNNNACPAPTGLDITILEDFEDVDEWTDSENNGDRNIQDVVSVTGNALEYVGTSLVSYYEYDEDEYGIYGRRVDSGDAAWQIRVTNSAALELIYVYSFGNGNFGTHAEDSYQDTGIAFDANTWYWIGIKRNGDHSTDISIYNEAKTVRLFHLPDTDNIADRTWSAGDSRFYTRAYTAGAAVTSYFDELTDRGTIPIPFSYTLGDEEIPITAPAMTGIDLNATYAKENDHIKVTASGVADRESDDLTLLCGTAPNPTTDTNNFCTAFGVASPYSDVSCTGDGLTGDGSKTIYCRLYDGIVYSIDQNTDTYTADNTAPTVSSAIMNAGANLIGVDYDFNVTMSDAGSGLATTTYKCWSSGLAEATCTDANWDCRTGSLTDNGSDSYGAVVTGSLKDTSGTWTCKGYATDNVELQGTDTDTETMNETTGYTVDTTTITYAGTQGSTENAATTDQANAYVIFTHNGNVDLNLLNNCDALTYSAYTIPASNHKWLDSDNYAGANACNGQNQEVDATWSKGTYPSSSVTNAYFWLDVPVAQALGSYTGTITVGATKSG